MATSGSILSSSITSVQKSYSRGKKAKAQCPICGDVVLYPTLVRDYRGVYVCPGCKDPKHPQENIKIFVDPQALEHPQPLRDTESGAVTVRPYPIVRAAFSIRPVTATGD